MGWDISLDKQDNFVKIIEKCIRMEQSDYDELSRNAFEYARKKTDDKEATKQNKELFL